MCYFYRVASKKSIGVVFWGAGGEVGEWEWARARGRSLKLAKTQAKDTDGDGHGDARSSSRKRSLNYIRGREFYDLFGFCIH